MRRFSIIAYPWDLADEGFESVLDRLGGEVGATGLTLWGAARPIQRVRVRAVEPRVVRCGGGALFLPSDRHYVDTPCKPVVCSLVHRMAPLSKMVEAARVRGLDVRVVLSAGLTGEMARRYPEVACENVFGARSQYGVCVRNPAVQSCLAGMVADLSADLEPDGVIVTDVTTGWHEVYSADVEGIDSLGASERALLSLCFCAACREAAQAEGVDVRAARESAKAVLQAALERSGGTTAGVLLESAPPVAGFVKWQAGRVGRLLDRLTDGCPGKLYLDGGNANPLLEGSVNIPESSGVIRIHEYRDNAGDMKVHGRGDELRIPAAVTAGGGGAHLVKALPEALESGFVGFDIDDYGLLSDAGLTSVKQAFRIGRRSGGDGG